MYVKKIDTKGMCKLHISKNGWNGGKRMISNQILQNTIEGLKGISKVDFCVATGISRPYLDRIEDGTANFTLKVLFKIAPALGMTVSELLEGIE